MNFSLYPKALAQPWPGVEFVQINKHSHICSVNRRNVKATILEISDHSQAVLTGNRWQEKVDTNFVH